MVHYTRHSLEIAEQSVAMFQRRLARADSLSRDVLPRQLAAAKETVRQLKVERDQQGSK